MKKFLEQYGYTIVAVLVIICLTATITPLGKIVKSNISNLVVNFS